MARPTCLLALALAAPLVLASCSVGDATDGSGGGSGASAGGDLTFSVITHGSAGDAFWDVVQNGAEAAGEDLGVSVD
jgi:simple sugar transport system substrate-binding protein